MRLLDKILGRDDEPEQVYLIGREARRRAGRQAGVLKGSRAHVGRMSDRRKALPSLATHIAVRTPDYRIVRLPHPAFRAATTTE